jgi:hypothetical protein
MFIKLTSVVLGTPVYVCSDAVVGVQANQETRHGTQLSYTVVYTEHQQFAVKETPDQVMALLNPTPA